MNEIKISLLPWDTEFFGYKVGEITLKNYNSNNDFSSFDLIYLKSDTENQITVNGFERSFSETKIVYEKYLKNVNETTFQNIFSIQDVKSNKSKLYELAFESGKHSRFILDSKFGINKFKELYQTWLDNSVNNTIADDVLIYLENDEILGFASYKIHGNFAQIGLLAVDVNTQGKGIGSKLLHSLEQKIYQKGTQRLIIPTQLSNKKACSFYEKQGYSIQEKIHITHFWKKKSHERPKF